MGACESKAKSTLIRVKDVGPSLPSLGAITCSVTSCSGTPVTADLGEQRKLLREDGGAMIYRPKFPVIT